MNKLNVFNNLCIKDPRSSFYVGGDIGEPRKNCNCENCFSGRDIMAIEILNLKKTIENMVNAMKLTSVILPLNNEILNKKQNEIGQYNTIAIKD